MSTALPRKPPPSPPPCYISGWPCEECWGFCASKKPGLLERYFHRRKYGHNPVPMATSDEDMKADQIARAQAYKRRHEAMVCDVPEAAQEMVDDQGHVLEGDRG